MRNKLLPLLLLIVLSFSGCAVRTPAPTVQFPFPARPELHQCNPKPEIEGRVDGENVILSTKDATRLRTWYTELEICHLENEVLLNAHIEKLENRLKALGFSQ